MNENVDIYLKRIYKDILDNGEDCNQERTGVGTRRTFGQYFKIDVSKYAPVSQLRPIHWRGAVTEALWILQQCTTNIKYLKDNGCGYWDAWADENGELGKIYSYQARKFECLKGTVDQVKELINGLKINPFGRRHIITLWNPANIKFQESGKLPPCHLLSQFYLTKDKRLDIQVYQRSCDFILGVPHDLVIYKVILDLVAREIGAHPGIMSYTFGDSHIYMNHIPAAKELVSRNTDFESFPKLVIDSDKDIFNITPTEIKVVDYKPLFFDKEKFDVKVAI